MQNAEKEIQQILDESVKLAEQLKQQMEEQTKKDLSDMAQKIEIKLRQSAS